MTACHLVFKGKVGDDGTPRTANQPSKSAHGEPPAHTEKDGEYRDSGIKSTRNEEIAAERCSPSFCSQVRGYALRAYVSHLDAWCSASTKRTVPDFERITMDCVSTRSFW